MFQLTLAVIIAMFILDLSLSILNYRHRGQPIPENVADVYNAEDYQKWLNYTRETHRLSILQKVIHTVVLILFLVFGIFPAIAAAASRYSEDPVLQTILFLGFYAMISFFLDIRFTWYRIFSIEERYGFNRSTVYTFLMDQMKSLVLTVVVGGGLLYVLLTLYLRMGNGFLFYAWLLIMGLSLLMNILYTKVFIRIFNKLTPLPDGELKDKIEALGTRSGYGIRGISVMDASKRSARLNAFFSGFGKFKHIVLYDTLLEKCTPDEIVSVLAHEIGHARHKDVLRNFLISAVQISVYLALLTFFLSSKEFAQAFGFQDVHMGFALILFGILMEPFGILLSIPLSAISRKAEYRADGYAAEMGYRDAMVSTLKVLARENFSNLTPHPLVVKMTYSHPPVSQRIQSLQAWKPATS
jgi:STE24 endopeptidase